MTLLLTDRPPPVRHRPPRAKIEVAAQATVWSARALIAVVWLSYSIFATYIVARFVVPIFTGTPDTWNHSIPNLYVREGATGNIGMGVHLVLGALLMFLGPIQLIGAVRTWSPRLHRWIGWVYGGSAFVTGIAGIVYILMRGTIGGWPMSLSFFSGGLITSVCAFETIRHAIARRLDVHRAWGIRLFSILLSGWLYRMYYGVWGVFFGRLGRTETLDGWFDVLLLLLYYFPTMAAAELFIRSRRHPQSVGAQASATAALVFATAFLALGTYAYTRGLWGPVILSHLTGGNA